MWTGIVALGKKKRRSKDRYVCLLLVILGRQIPDHLYLSLYLYIYLYFQWNDAFQLFVKNYCTQSLSSSQLQSSQQPLSLGFDSKGKHMFTNTDNVASFSSFHLMVSSSLICMSISVNIYVLYQGLGVHAILNRISSVLKQIKTNSPADNNRFVAITLWRRIMYSIDYPLHLYYPQTIIMKYTYRSHSISSSLSILSISFDTYIQCIYIFFYNSGSVSELTHFSVLSQGLSTYIKASLSKSQYQQFNIHIETALHGWLKSMAK